MSNIEQLKKLVLEGGYDEDSRKQVLDLEDRFHTLLMAEKLGENPIIKEFVNYLTLQAENCTFLLSNDRKLTDLERSRLFDKREMCEHFTKLFTGSEKESVEQSIKALLDRAEII